MQKNLFFLLIAFSILGAQNLLNTHSFDHTSPAAHHHTIETASHDNHNHDDHKHDHHNHHNHEDTNDCYLCFASNIHKSITLSTTPSLFIPPNNPKQAVFYSTTLIQTAQRSSTPIRAPPRFLI